MTNEEAKRIIEALLFATHSPVSINELTSTLEDVDSRVVRDLVYELKTEYENQNRSFSITEIAGGFQIITDSCYASWIRKLIGKEKTQRLSMPSLETLAIVVYKQPLTRSEIETIRGVNIEGILEGLLEKKLIKTSGRKEAPGRPFVYTTTEQFLIHFGLKSLEDLPKLKEFAEKDVQAGEKDLIVENLTSEKKEEASDGTSAVAKTN
ncbi:MAG: SMC-Scp complex subunit ScpB [Candidatus Omnitrophica bacterium]|nr:SMC-Scp complex subunit ScpB [Candidatus Omnitrophota bacterium]